MAVDPQTNQVLQGILDVLKQQAIYLRRQHGWLIAIADAVREDAELAKRLEQHPFYDQGPRQDVRITDAMIQTIDALIQQLRKN